MPLKIEVYSKDYCPFCKKTKQTLEFLGLPFEEFDITRNAALTSEMHTRSQRKTVPQIFINGKHIGGSDDFHQALRNGLLKDLANGVVQ
ncbi:glutathione S-transferase N-terminal domain-containing protein [Bowmanella sp. Y26]|uniref:glutaredoxin domain-containing protein n=1 Tax=Bowmanella yangjiangensis TaxID=2811230 RepID=UPI001BDBC38A|nr:glutaredoxin domain-containing protein [Bowmanella yangjiangensis]MBT1064076.1 glutathione S-transferase N-terminal domain-containing protein [Bowmanella yangjiangensis]